MVFRDARSFQDPAPSSIPRPPDPQTLDSPRAGRLAPVLPRGDHRRRTAQLVALGSLVVDCLLVAGKLAAALATGSLGLLSDAVQSGLDLIASSFAFLAVRAASKPADYEHPYGHARAENLAAFGEGLLLCVAALVIGFEGVRRIAGQAAAVQPSWFAYLILGITIAVEATRTTVLRRVARRERQPRPCRLGAESPRRHRLGGRGPDRADSDAGRRPRSRCGGSADRLAHHPAHRHPARVAVRRHPDRSGTARRG